MTFNYILVMIFGSLVTMIPMINRKQDPYKVVFYSTVSSWMAVLLLFWILYLTGNDIGSQIKENVDFIVENLSKDDKFLKMMSNIDGSESANIELIRSIIDISIIIIPSVLMILGNIVSVCLYKSIWNMFYRKRKEVSKFLIKNYHLTHRSLVCWIVIYIIAYFINKVGYSNGEIVAINLEIIIRLLLMVEGALALVDIGYKYKKYKRSTMYVVTFVVYLIPFGTLILVMLGVISSIYNIRRNDLVKKLKG